MPENDGESRYRIKHPDRAVRADRYTVRIEVLRLAKMAPKPKHLAGPTTMTLSNTGALGVRGLNVRCRDCRLSTYCRTYSPIGAKNARNFRSL